MASLPSSSPLWCSNCTSRKVETFAALLAARTHPPGVCRKFHFSWHLLEQSSSLAARHSSHRRARALGEFTSPVLAIARSFCNRVDEPDQFCPLVRCGIWCGTFFPQSALPSLSPSLSPSMGERFRSCPRAGQRSQRQTLLTVLFHCHSARLCQSVDFDCALSYRFDHLVSARPPVRKGSY